MIERLFPFYLVFLAVGTVGLALAFFWRRAVIRTVAFRYSLFAFLFAAFFVPLWQMVYDPIRPRARATFDRKGDFVPVVIRAQNASEDFSRIEWHYEDGTVIKDQESVERTLSRPGVYKIEVVAFGQTFAGNIEDRFSASFNVADEPPRLPKKTTKVYTFQVSGSNEHITRTFTPEPGYKIVNAHYELQRGEAARVSDFTFNESGAKIGVAVSGSKRMAGLTLKTVKGFASGIVTLELEEIAPTTVKQ